VVPELSDASPIVADRPVVTDVVDGPDGRQFTVTLAPGQRLPAHRNPSRVAITAVAGSGEITVDGEVRALPPGTFVQLEPNVEHAVQAGSEGLELAVKQVCNCCEHC
jgi:quercetin dioxygenase-like cupin family protein